MGAHKHTKKEPNGLTVSQNRKINERIRGRLYCSHRFCDFHGTSPKRLAVHGGYRHDNRRWSCTTCNTDYCHDEAFKSHDFRCHNKVRAQTTVEDLQQRFPGLQRRGGPGLGPFPAQQATVSNATASQPSTATAAVSSSSATGKKANSIKTHTASNQGSSSKNANIHKAAVHNQATRHPDLTVQSQDQQQPFPADHGFEEHDASDLMSFSHLNTMPSDHPAASTNIFEYRGFHYEVPVEVPEHEDGGMQDAEDATAGVDHSLAEEIVDPYLLWRDNLAIGGVYVGPLVEPQVYPGQDFAMVGGVVTNVTHLLGGNYDNTAPSEEEVAGSSETDVIEDVGLENGMPGESEMSGGQANGDGYGGKT